MINGLSNSSITLQKNKNGYFIKKYSNNKRINNQRNKQEFFIDFIHKISSLSLMFDIPKIIDYTENSFSMQFINGNNIIDIIEENNIDQIENLIDKLFFLIQIELNTSNEVIEANQIFLNKLSLLEHYIPNDLYVKINMLLFEKSVISPIGLCHGDLTFSNLIFTDKIIMIDFCDCFIESPYQDIAKMMQEIFLKWSYIMYNNEVDSVKIDIGYEYIKNIFIDKLTNFIVKNRLDGELLTLYYIFVLLRILPYLKNKQIKNNLIGEIEHAYFNLTSGWKLI